MTAEPARRRRTIVVDASVLVSAIVDSGPEGVWAERVLADCALIAPHLVLAEATNIFRRLERGRSLPPAEASAARRDLLRLDIELVPFEPFADRVWDLRATLTAYDAWYVAVAERLDLRLATLDRKLARAPGPLCAFLAPGQDALGVTR